MRSDINTGEILALMCRDGQEVFGEFVDIDNGYIRLHEPAFAIDSPPDTPDGYYKKLLISSTEGGNFHDDIDINENMVIHVRKVKKGSDLWTVYVNSSSKMGSKMPEKKEYKS